MRGSLMSRLVKKAVWGELVFDFRIPFRKFSFVSRSQSPPASLFVSPFSSIPEAFLS
jgi:hypothetical protein